MDLAKAKAVVTGAASELGLGFATASKIIAAGGQVALLDVNDDDGAKSAALLGDRA
ncbi:MAG: 3-hydroxyacyl-CoA dehydrogenase, partial [Woeseia sp.]|nr:3-hydroxyacyl-CoA dehydrogenase [Woeseia sp.]